MRGHRGSLRLGLLPGPGGSLDRSATRCTAGGLFNAGPSPAARKGRGPPPRD